SSSNDSNLDPATSSIQSEDDQMGLVRDEEDFVGGSSKAAPSVDNFEDPFEIAIDEDNPNEAAEDHNPRRSSKDGTTLTAGDVAKDVIDRTLWTTSWSGGFQVNTELIPKMIPTVSSLYVIGTVRDIAMAN